MAGNNPLARPLYRPMRPRDPGAPRRQTLLELLFDLAFSIASGFAAVHLAEALHADGWGGATLAFAIVFFEIWWAWLNFGWLSSAYDTDDGLTWLLTTVMVLGACVLAAGTSSPLVEREVVITIGYAVMRLPLAAQWVRAAMGDPARRATCLRFGAGLVVLLLAWVVRLALPGPWLLPLFFLLGALELAVPFWAQRRGRIPTNPAHLAGRYERFTLTVAAQVVAAVVYAVQTGIAEGAARVPLVTAAALSLGVVVCLVWLYSTAPHARLAGRAFAKYWEYGHYVILSAIGAVAAGSRFLAERVSGPAGAAQPWAAHPLVTAVALAVAAMWLVGVAPAAERGAGMWTHGRYLAAVLLIVLAGVVAPGPLWAVGIVIVVLFALAASESISTAPPFGAADR